MLNAIFLRHLTQQKFSASNFLCHFRKISTSHVQNVKFSQLQIEECGANQRNEKPKWSSEKILFGQLFTDHMLRVDYTPEQGWTAPRICPMHNLQIHPAAKVLHYAQELFEGMKAYRGTDNKIRLFRPDMNMKRMLISAERIALPTFDGDELIRCLKKLIRLDADWVPPYDNYSSLYIRPTMIGTEGTLGVAGARSAMLFIILSPVGAYFPTGVKPVSLYADPTFVRAWPGGCGNKKLGPNYGPTIAVQKIAESRGYQQVLWVYGEDSQLTEVGTMNIFVFLKNESGERELITPPLEDGIILPGVTRASILDLTRQWGEFKISERRVTMNEVKRALSENRLIEMFGAGTACVVAPIGQINFLGEDLNIPCDMDPQKSLSMRLLKNLTDIFYGKVIHPWAVDIDS